MDILRKFIFCDIFSEGNLEEKTRELITITALSVLQCLSQLKVHIGAGLKIGLLPLEIRESIYQLAPFIGFPRTLNAISVMNQVFEQKGLKSRGSIPFCFLDWNKKRRIFLRFIFLVASRGIEPLIPPWEGGVLTAWPRGLKVVHKYISRKKWNLQVFLIFKYLKRLFFVKKVWYC